MKAFLRRLFCMHSDPRKWKHLRNYFCVGSWETQEEWQCTNCGKITHLDHLEQK